MKSLDFTPGDLKKNNMAVTLVVSLVLAVCLSLFMVGYCNSAGQEGQFDTFGHGAWHGAVVGLLVAMPALIINGIFEQKNFVNLLLNSIYWVTTISLMGGVIDVTHH